MVVLDTCALIELCKKTPHFSKKTLNAIETGAHILSISFAEIACKVKLAKLEIDVSPKALYKEFRQIETADIVDIGLEEWLNSIELNWPDNKDPADRVITAYAAQRNLSIVTSDKKLKNFIKK